MTNKDIFLGALALVGEPVGLSAADYAERTPYIIANFITENAALDDKYRAAVGEAPKESVCTVFAADDDEFPLLPRFSSAAQQMPPPTRNAHRQFLTMGDFGAWALAYFL